MTHLDRRRFLRTTTVAAAGGMLSTTPGSIAIAADDPPRPANPAFASDWHRLPDRVWIGPAFWANPLQDWRLADGRLECTNPAANRNVHLLTRDLAEGSGDVEMKVTLGRVGGKLSAGKGSAGFRIGVRGPLAEYRNNIVFGTGLDAGITADGRLFVGRPADGEKIGLDRDDVTLVLKTSNVDGVPALELRALDTESGNELGLARLTGPRVPNLVGNIALVSNFGSAGRGGNQDSPFAGVGNGKFWFHNLRVDGTKLGVHEDRAYGPILFSQYTLHVGTLTLTAQMPPIGEQDSQAVELWGTTTAGNAVRLDEATIDGDARTATFRIANRDATTDAPYRLVWEQRFTDGATASFDWTGTIRRDPVDRDVLTVADISCNIHAAFPNHDYTANVAKLDPDFVAFVGDQFYESTGGYGVVREPVETAILDYLHKWSMHGWTWRDVIRDRPSISIPDDHDVYQGNIWGEAGAGPQRTQESGGYGMPVRWVNVVHRTQTSHHPPSPDPEPLESGITVYHGPLVYGRVGFAILADRMFKTGPEGVVPPTKGRGDHVTDPNFDPKSADVEGAELLGDRQMRFLADWARDWTGADMKALVSQTIFASMATTHGGNRERLVADYDANGWPQAARNEAVRAIRKCFAVHLAGDQHLPAVVQYGVDGHRDAAVAFAGPAVNVGYPRWWEPLGSEGQPLDPLGDHVDHMGHPLTVLAVKNGEVAPRRGVLESMQDKASGLGIVRFDKKRRTVTFECWPFLADPTTDPQFEGWPVTVRQFENAPRAAARLPTFEFADLDAPVVEVHDAQAEHVYSVRVSGTSFRPFVFAEGTYVVRIIGDDGEVVAEERVTSGDERTIRVERA